MKRIALLVALLLPLPSGAVDRILRDSAGNHIRLTEKACLSEKGALSTIPPAARANMKAAEVKWEGKVYAACWGFIPSVGVFIIDETSDQGFLDPSGFKPVSDT